ncbi:CBS domain-containing protein, partial [Rhodovulum sp.]|uniref:CBS domain-containing protein n=1 Tax=Rhodovulum sp. TaxID=34009 RepID=UPI0018422873
MSDPEAGILESLRQVPPFDLIPEDALAALGPGIRRITVGPGQTICTEGERLDGLFVIESGTVDIETGGSDLIAHRGPGDVVGERGLLRLGRATLTARAVSEVTLLVLSKAAFHDLMDEVPAFAGWFQRALPGRVAAAGDEAAGLTALRVADLMTPTPITCPVGSRVSDVARIMRDKNISSVMVMEGETLAGIVTVRDLTNKVLAEGLDGATPATQVMTRDLITIPPDALGLDALMTLADNNISHLPVAEAGRVVGLIGRTDLFRQQAATASHIIVEIVDADGPEAMTRVVAKVPALLAQLVRSG